MNNSSYQFSSPCDKSQASFIGTKKSHQYSHIGSYTSYIHNLRIMLFAVSYLSSSIHKHNSGVYNVSRIGYRYTFKGSKIRTYFSKIGVMDEY